ncbi:DUF1152 domain-containing protein [Myxococcota bacterium]|nr:DUF1152 domain-containing protein [Myxococcota bacterium]MBU1430032.1 DUF1152 domain-containing protein [Myxococcota bacterium]MBU1899429.1 DUF1152 domain-containing protein [Myxococcota bacterium]
MKLIDPILQQLSHARRILIAGAGGGYDVLGAVPLLAELEAMGRTVHLASLTFSQTRHLQPFSPGLYPTSAKDARPDAYCPEAWLAKWWSARGGRERRVWLFDKAGVATLAEHYQRLSTELDLDAIILVDGGIDALLRGDETNLGTPSEDLASLMAVRQTKVKHRFLTCVGMGTELRDGIPHAQALERIAHLTERGGFLGAASLLKQTQGGAAYLSALEYVFQNQRGQKRSHVHSCIFKAMSGHFGELGPQVWISPLMNMMWFFDLDLVADTHLFARHLVLTETIGEVTAYVEGLRKAQKVRPRTEIPI